MCVFMIREEISVGKDISYCWYRWCMKGVCSVTYEVTLRCFENTEGVCRGRSVYERMVRVVYMGVGKWEECV